MSSPRLRELIINSQAENLAQVYTTVKYPRSRYQEISTKVINYLNEQGFTID